MSYWNALSQLVKNNSIIIERPKGSAHPRFPEVIYPLDYGYLENTTTVDGGGIDIIVGSDSIQKIFGIICTVDSLKKDAEIKILYQCTEYESQVALSFFNSYYLSALMIKNTEK